MRTFLTVCLVLVSAAAHAEENPYSANYMLRGCKWVLQQENGAQLETVEMLRAYECAGAVKVLNVLASVLPPSGRFCTPPNSTIGQSIKVIVAELDKRPAELHLPFAVVASKALAKVWPCPTDGSQGR